MMIHFDSVLVIFGNEWICAQLNCEFLLSWDLVVIECCPLVLLVANGTWVWQQCHFIWCHLPYWISKARVPVCSCICTLFQATNSQKLKWQPLLVLSLNLFLWCTKELVSLLNCHCHGYFCFCCCVWVNKTKLKVLLWLTETSETYFQNLKWTAWSFFLHSHYC